MSVREPESFRGGILRTVAGVAPQTIHSWRLELGNRPGTGHKRYSATDAVAIRIMVMLVHQGISASTGRSIVHGIMPELPRLIDDYRQERSKRGRWPQDGGIFAIVKNPCPVVPNHERSAWLNFVSAENLGDHLKDRSSGQVIIVIPIWRAIYATLFKIEQVVHGEIPADDTDHDL